VTDADHRATPAPVVGLVGGLASGKSTVARLLAERGARIVDADRIGHEMIERPEVVEDVVQAFGSGVLDDAGRVDRGRLAERVFGDQKAVQKLNAIIHPPIIRRAREQVAALRMQPGVPLVVLDAPLLMETDLHRNMCQALLFVDSPQELRRRRAVTERGMDAAQFDKRQEVQLPVDTKRQRADYVVDNSGTLEELRSQVERLWPDLYQLGTRVRG